MSEIQNMINTMHKGNIEAITKGVASRVPIVALNAIVAGTNYKVRDNAFIEGVWKATESDESVLGVPLNAFAAASLHLLGEKKYSGKDTIIIAMIDTKLKM